MTETEFEKHWQEWSEKEAENYKIIKNKSGKNVRRYLKKNYLHFDNRFWFPDRKDELKTILVNGLRTYHKSHKRMESWAFSPFLKVLIKTPRYKYQTEESRYDLETKIRPICFASHIDSLIFGFYAHVLTKKYEDYIEKRGFENSVLAYRTNLDGKCNIQFSKEVFDEIKTRGCCTAIALDIKGYFDHIDHTILLEKWKKVLGDNLPEDQFKIYKVLTRYSYVNKNSILKKYNINLKKLSERPKTLLELIPGGANCTKYQKLRDDKLIVQNKEINKENRRPIGIPQGSGMSALLSNIFLIDFDEDIALKGEKEGFLYRRYCDDIIIICESEKAFKIQDEIINKIHDEYYLEIQPKKVEVIEFRKNSNGLVRSFNIKKQSEKGVDNTDACNEKFFYKSLQYLGFEYNGQDVFIRSSSLSRYFRRMKSRITRTVLMAYSSKSKSDLIWKQKLFHRYSHLGKRNFLSYAYNASKEYYTNAKGETKEGMNSNAIKKQLKRHFEILITNLVNENRYRYQHKLKRGKVINIKKI